MPAEIDSSEQVKSLFYHYQMQILIYTVLIDLDVLSRIISEIFFCFLI